jgi:adenylate kinase family enzyme
MLKTETTGLCFWYHSHMSRILVTGNAGSGKSSVATKLAQMLSHPLYGVDKLVWKENWQKTSSADRDKEVAAIIEQESWVI